MEKISRYIDSRMRLRSSFPERMPQTPVSRRSRAYDRLMALFTRWAPTDEDARHQFRDRFEAGRAVGMWYEDFRQMTDEEVRDLLNRIEQKEVVH